MSNTYTKQKETAMTTTQRRHLSGIMNDAWALARQGAKKFGGNVRLYFAIALKLVWRDSRNRTLESRGRSVWRKGVGTQMWMPGVPLPEQVERGQAVLPGLLLK